jgi:hypothetical protein
VERLKFMPQILPPFWFWPIFDPILIAVAVYFGWKADQFGKTILAAIIALVASSLAGWLIASAGLPWIAPAGPNFPSLLPVRTIAAFLWASLAFGVRYLLQRSKKT